MHRILWGLGGEVTLSVILLQLSSPKVWREEVVEMEGAARGEPIQLTQLFGEEPYAQCPPWSNQAALVTRLLHNSVASSLFVLTSSTCLNWPQWAHQGMALGQAAWPFHLRSSLK